MSPSTRWRRRRRLESGVYPERRVDPSILADSIRRFFSARSVADEWVTLTLTGKAVDTQWQEMAEDSTGRRNEFLHTRLVPRG